MVHLDELQEKYTSQGLTVLALTNEVRSKVDAFVDKNKAKHPIVIESGDSTESYEVGGFPSSFLIGPTGRVLWSGHPGNLPAATIEEALTGAKLLPETPKRLDPIRTALDKEKYAEASAKVAKVLLEPLAPDEKEAAEKLRDWIEWFVKSPIDGAKAQAEKGDYYGASLTLTDATKSLKGLPAATEAATLLKELLADPTHKEEVTAGERLAKAREKAKGEDPKKAILLYKPIASKYGSTKAGAKAQQIIDDLEKKEAAEKAK